MVPLTGMSVVLPEGTYLILFNGTALNDTTNQQGSVVLALNGANIPETSRQIVTTAGLRYTMSIIHVLTLTSSSTISVNWNVNGGTGTFYKRTLAALMLN